MIVKEIGRQYVTVSLSESDLVFLAHGLDGDETFSAFAIAFRSLGGLAGLRGDLPVTGDRGVVDVLTSAGLPVVGAGCEDPRCGECGGADGAP